MTFELNIDSDSRLKKLLGSLIARLASLILLLN